MAFTIGYRQMAWLSGLTRERPTQASLPVWSDRRH